MQGLPGYLGFIHQSDSNSKFSVEEVFPNSTTIVSGDPSSPIRENPDFSSPPNFKWSSENNGYFSNGSIHLSFPKSNIQFDADMSEPTFWNPKNPGEGPEGIAQYLPLQQHWFVYSLKSKVNYSYKSPKGNLQGSGFAHQEKNWGKSFPSQWVWAEATSKDGKYLFALSGGTVPVVGPIAVTAWLIGWRSPKHVLNFHPQDLTSAFDPKISACNGTYSMDVVNAATGKRLYVRISAPISTFTALAVPWEKGFIPRGCIESYASTTIVQVYSWGTLVEEVTITGSALEFGGGYLCKKKEIVEQVSQQLPLV